MRIITEHLGPKFPKEFYIPSVMIRLLRREMTCRDEVFQTEIESYTEYL